MGRQRPSAGLPLQGRHRRAARRSSPVVEWPASRTRAGRSTGELPISPTSVSAAAISPPVPPFPRGTRVILKIKTANLEVRAGGVVLVAHPEFGMGVEFLQTTTEQRDQVLRMITTLRENGDKSPELQVEPDGLEMPLDDRLAMSQASTTEVSGTEDALVDLFRHQFRAPVETFLEQMREQRQSTSAISS